MPKKATPTKAKTEPTTPTTPTTPTPPAEPAVKPAAPQGAQLAQDPIPTPPAATTEVSTDASEKDLLAEYNKMRNTNANRTNQILLINKLNIEGEDGKPIINPDFGKLFAVSYDKDGEETREVINFQEAEFFPAKIRVQVMCKDVDAKNKALYWCRESDEFEEIELFDQDGKVVYQGDYKGAKDQFNLSMKSVCYTIYQGKAYRWRITGASFDTWFKVKNLILKAARPTTFKVASITAQKNGSVDYNEMEFVVGKELFGEDLKYAIGKMNEVNAALAAHYEKIAEKDEKKATLDDVAGELEGSKEEKIEDLPF